MIYIYEFPYKYVYDLKKKNELNIFADHFEKFIWIYNLIAGSGTGGSSTRSPIVTSTTTTTTTAAPVVSINTTQSGANPLSRFLQSKW